MKSCSSCKNFDELSICRDCIDHYMRDMADKRTGHTGNAEFGIKWEEIKEGDKTWNSK